MTRNRIEACSPESFLTLRFTHAERESLRRRALSRKAADRALCLTWLQTGADQRQNRRFLLELVDLFVSDTRSRWRGLCNVLWHFPELYPDDLWPYVVKWGTARSRDLRSGVACCLLEHVLEYHFAQFFPLCRQLIESGDARFADTLSMCWKMGQAEEPENAKAFNALTARVKQGHGSPGIISP